MAERYSEIAIIDISSNEIRMYIAEKKGDRINFLENLKYPLNLAKDAFGIGAISFEKVNKLCDCLSGFIKICKDYGVKYIKSVATTAVREASNKDYILDQIRIKTGLNVKIIDESAEKLYIFKMLSHILKPNLQGTTTLMAHIGSGSVGIAYCDGENTSLMQSIKIGALRVSELFENMHDNSFEFYLMIDEYLRSYTYDLKSLLPDKIKSLTVSGSEAPIIATMCSAKNEGLFFTADRKAFLNLYEEIKFKSIDMIVKQYALSPERNETLLPAMCIYRILLEFSDTDTIITPNTSLGEALVFEYFESAEFDAINKNFNRNILETTMKIAAKYNIPEKHYMAVSNYCNDIFDKMRKIHGMGKRDKLLLQIAAILHDCGKFVNITNHHIHSYNLIKGSEIAGLTSEEIEIVANIALYHSLAVPGISDSNYKELKSSKKVLVSKLSAILRLADALDRSGKQKIDSIDVKLASDTIIIYARTSLANIGLEYWALMEKCNFFREVFGMEVVLKAIKEV